MSQVQVQVQVHNQTKFFLFFLFFFSRTSLNLFVSYLINLLFFIYSKHYRIFF